jgi:hypothetical protein
MQVKDPFYPKFDGQISFSKERRPPNITDMTVGFHPVTDNPIRMGYVPGWSDLHTLIERLGDLEYAVGEGRVVPAKWEPFYQQCPRCRYREAYAWARIQLQNPVEFGLALALYVGDETEPTDPMTQANQTILLAEGEQSRTTRKLMLAESLGLWESQAAEWIDHTTISCLALGIKVPADALANRIKHALSPLAKDLHEHHDTEDSPGAVGACGTGRGYDPRLLQMSAWTPNFGLVILPVDDKFHALKREILLMDLGKVVLLRARRTVRTVPWDKVTLVHTFEGSLIFEVAGEPSLTVHGFRNLDKVLQTAQECYQTATERVLQALATKVVSPMPRSSKF